MIIIEGEEREIELEFRLIEQSSEMDVLTVDGFTEADAASECID